MEQQSTWSKHHQIKAGVIKKLNNQRRSTTAVHLQYPPTAGMTAADLSFHFSPFISFLSFDAPFIFSTHWSCEIFLLLSPEATFPLHTGFRLLLTFNTLLLLFLYILLSPIIWIGVLFSWHWLGSSHLLWLLLILFLLTSIFLSVTFDCEQRTAFLKFKSSYYTF